jgi:hypothetical protein
VFLGKDLRLKQHEFGLVFIDLPVEFVPVRVGFSGLDMVAKTANDFLELIRIWTLLVQTLSTHAALALQ